MVGNGEFVVASQLHENLKAEEAVARGTQVSRCDSSTISRPSSLIVIALSGLGRERSQGMCQRLCAHAMDQCRGRDCHGEPAGITGARQQQLAGIFWRERKNRMYEIMCGVGCRLLRPPSRKCFRPQSTAHSRQRRLARCCRFTALARCHRSFTNATRDPPAHRGRLLSTVLCPRCTCGVAGGT